MSSGFVLDPSCYSPLGVARYWVWPSSLPSMCQESLNTVSSFVAPKVGHYVFVLLLTSLLEVPFYYATFTWGGRRKLTEAKQTRSSTAWLSSALLCNLSSHPVVYFVFPIFAAYLRIKYIHMLVAAEISAPLLEALLLIAVWKVPVRRAVLGMWVANLSSWWIGVYGV